MNDIDRIQIDFDPTPFVIDDWGELFVLSSQEEDGLNLFIMEELSE